jgi:hypothetical protein
VFGKRRAEPNQQFRQKANLVGNKINLALDSAKAGADPEGKPSELAAFRDDWGVLLLAPAHALREEYLGRAKEAGIGLNSSTEENQG